MKVEASTVALGAEKVPAIPMSSSQKWIQIIHWTSVISGALSASGATVLAAFSHGNTTEVTVLYSVAVLFMTASQVIHKFADSLDHQQTLATAIAVTLPVAQEAEKTIEETVNKMTKNLRATP